MAMADTEDKPSLIERYQAATETSDLTLSDHRAGAPDILIAAALSAEVVGTDLARLMGEWDSSAKPQMPSPAIIKAVAQRLRESDARASVKPTTKAEIRARAEAMGWYRRELRLFAQGLKSRAECVEHVRRWCELKGLDQDYAGAALYHWLDPNCGACTGLRLTKAADAPSLTKTCPACSGTGKTRLTDQAFRVGEWLDGCILRARRDLGGNRQAVRDAKRWIAEKR